jgi:hypothetical protein
MNMASADPKQTAMDYTSTSNLLISRLSKGGRKSKGSRRSRRSKRNKTNINFKKKYSNFKKFQSIRNLKKIKFHTRSRRRRGKKYRGGATAPNIPFVHLSPNGGALQETGNAFEVSKNTALEQSKYDNTAVFKK